MVLLIMENIFHGSLDFFQELTKFLEGGSGKKIPPTWSDECCELRCVFIQRSLEKSLGSIQFTEEGGFYETIRDVFN